MSYRVEIKIEDTDTKETTTITLPDLAADELARLHLPVGQLFRDGVLFCRSTNTPAVVGAQTQGNVVVLP
jgi:hypothetical protein